MYTIETLGEADSSESESSSASAFGMNPQEKQKIIGLGIRDLRLPPAIETLADCKPRQLAYVMSGVYPWLLPTDTLETGGELASLLHVVLLCAGNVLATISHGLDDCCVRV